jgi:tRNA 2-thiouridine synthesizing protein A
MARSPLPLSQISEGAWKLNCLGMLCPIPISKTGLAIRRIAIGDLLTIISDDPGVELDLRDWCSANRQELVHIEIEKGVYTTTVRKLR